MNKNEVWDILEKSWKRVLDNYIIQSHMIQLKRDLPYWHCERANTSFLAAAAWKIGGIAIEEYYTERASANDKNASKGHCDLWVKFKDFSFSAEVKQLFPKIYNKESIKCKLDQAKKQLKSLSRKDKLASTCLFSICFVCPRLEVVTEFINFVNRINRDFRNDNCRICYFDKSKLANEIITWPSEDGKKEKFPGVIMVVKDIKE